MNLRHLFPSLVIVFIALLWSGQAFADDWTNTDVFVGVDDTAELLSEGAAVIDAREGTDFSRGHIDGAANLTWQDFVDGEATGEVVDDDRRLTALLQRAGISSDAPVIVYGNWSEEGAWGEEGRLFWTLEYLGHDEVHILEGGLPAWREAGHDVVGGQNGAATERGDFAVDRRSDLRMTTHRLTRAVALRNSFQIIDAREADEYAGAVKYGEARGGHIPGAEHVWWRDLFDDDGALKSPRAIRTKLEERGIDGDDDVVVYCTGGIRSGFVYAVLRAKGIDNVRNYDASMWDWTQNGAPVSTP